MSGEAVVFHGGVSADVLTRAVAEDLALSGRVAVRDAGEVDVGVDVGADQVEEAGAAAAAVVAACAHLTAAGLGMADEQLGDESGDFEEGVEEGSADD